MSKKIVIFGGGPAGLAAAHQLLQRQDGRFDVTIIEKEPRLGGLASTIPYKSFHIPRYYHHVIENNATTKAFLDRFGMLDDATWKPINLAIGVHGYYRNITRISELLRFPYLSFYEKLRFGLFGLYTLFLMDPSKIPDDMDAKEWLERYAGTHVTRKVFHELYAKNKFNTGLDMISAKQFANRLREREIYERFTYPKQGLQTFIDRLRDEIQNAGGTIIYPEEITNIDLRSKIVHCGKMEIKADAIINTIPIPEFLNVAKHLPSAYRKQLKRLRYCPAVCMTIATKGFLDPDVYWFNLFKEDVHVVIQHSVLYDGYPEKISWVLRYGGSEEDLPLSDEEITKKYGKALHKYFPETEIIWSKITRDRYGEPVYDKDYREYMPTYRTPVKGLYMAGIQVTYPKIRNMNSALESGLEVAKMIQEDVR